MQYGLPILYLRGPATSGVERRVFHDYQLRDRLRNLQLASDSVRQHDHGDSTSGISKFRGSYVESR
jgi:hypothetical protein